MKSFAVALFLASASGILVKNAHKTQEEVNIAADPAPAPGPAPGPSGPCDQEAQLRAEEMKLPAGEVWAKHQEMEKAEHECDVEKAEKALKEGDKKLSEWHDSIGDGRVVAVEGAGSTDVIGCPPEFRGPGCTTPAPKHMLLLGEVKEVAAPAPAPGPAPGPSGPCDQEAQLRAEIAKLPAGEVWAKHQVMEKAEHDCEVEKAKKALKEGDKKLSEWHDSIGDGRVVAVEGAGSTDVIGCPPEFRGPGCTTPAPKHM